MRTARFDAMGCAIAVGGATPRELQAIVGLFRQRDHVFSRSLAGSELNEVNDAAGSVVGVSPLFARAIGAALDAAQATAARRSDGGALERRAAARPPRPRACRVRLDLDRVARAAAVDDALQLLSGEGFVSAAGDAAVRGDAAVEVPGGGSVRLGRGGLSTSFGAATGSPWVQVTAAASTCLAAVTAAEAALLLGADGPGWLDERGASRALRRPGMGTCSRTARGTRGSPAPPPSRRRTAGARTRRTSRGRSSPPPTG